MKKNRYFFGVCVLVLFLTVSISSIGLTSEWPFRDGEVIRLVVPYTVGGGFDRVARMVVPSFQKNLQKMAGDKRINVIVENIAGAGGRIACEDVYNSPPDGTRVVMLNGLKGVASLQLEGANFDLDKFTYIGQINQSDYGISIRTEIPANTLVELIKYSQDQPVLICTDGFGAGGHTAGIMLQELLAEHDIKFNADYVHFASLPEGFTSIRRGETDVKFGSVDSILPYTEEGFVKLIVTLAKKRSEYFPQVKAVVEEDLPDDVTEIMATVFTVSRTIVAPPNLPEETANILREALAEALKDPEVLVRAKVANTPIVYLSAEEVKREFMFALEVSKKFQPLLKSRLGQ